MTKKKDEAQKDAPVAADPEIVRVAALLAPREEEDDAPVVVEPETTPELEPVIPKRKKAAPRTSHKVTEWCGQLNRDGKKYRAGEGINLSDEEAKALGKNVEPA